MGLGSFMQNFAIGALGQLNSGYDQQRRQQALEDQQNAEMVRNVAGDTINRYNAAEQKAQEDLLKHQQIFNVWGPYKGGLIESGVKPDDLRWYQQTGPAPADNYANNLDKIRWQNYQRMVNMVQSVPANKNFKGPNIGQTFQPPKPLGDGSGFGGDAIQQQQVQQLHGTGQPPAANQAAPQQQDMGQPQQQAGIPNDPLNPSYTIPGGMFYKPDQTPNNEGLIQVSKALDNNAISVVGTYFPGKIFKDAQGNMQFNFADGDINAGRLIENVKYFQYQLANDAMQKRIDAGQRPQDINTSDIGVYAVQGLRTLMDDLHAHGFTNDQTNVQVLGRMSQEEFFKAIVDARKDAKQRDQANTQDLPPDAAGSYLDPKKHPNDPNTAIVTKNYDTVVHLVQMAHNKSGMYDEDTDKFNARYKNKIVDNKGNPTSYKPKQVIPMSDQQAQAFVNKMPIAEYMKLVQYIEQNVQQQQQQQRIGDLNSTIQADPTGQGTQEEKQIMNGDEGSE